MAAVSRRRLLYLAAASLALAAFASTADEPKSTKQAKKDAPFPPGWEPVAQRDEIRPTFSFDPRGGPKGDGALVIVTGDSVGQQGRFEKTFPVTGGKFYRFSAVRKAENVATPRRSVLVRIVWQDSKGAAVPADVPPGREKE